MSSPPRSDSFPPAVVRDAFVIDDERQIRTLIAKVLVSAGFTPHQFSHVHDVEAALTCFSPEIIVLDLSLGQSDGIEVMRSLAAARFKGKVLLVSGHDPSTLGEVHRIGQRHGLSMLPFLHKPFHFADLKERFVAASEAVAGAAANGCLLAALENNWLELWYQPKIDLTSMSICGAEGLIRLRHPERGILHPAAFLPPPGDPLYRPLTDFVVRRALEDWPRFRAAGLAIQLAINVPASVLQRADFVAGVRKYLPRHADFRGLIVEITEHDAIIDPEMAREIAIQLGLYNIHVSIDDFGTGHSSLARFRELPFAELKLDRRFVDRCSSDERNRSVCQSVVDLAHRFEISAVAEGVETAADLKTLMGMGYQIAQGFFFARPMEIGDLVELPRFRAPHQKNLARAR